MARGRWEDLSNDYRKRLERGGISKSDYNSGASLSSARGHAATPERPTAAENNPQKYKDYISRRTNIVDKIQKIKADKFKYLGNYNEKRSKRVVKTDPFTNNPRGIKELKVILAIAEMWEAGDIDGWDELSELADGYESAFYYK